MKSLSRAPFLSAAFLLCSCLGGGKEDKILTEEEVEVVSINVEAQTLVTREIRRYCNEISGDVIDTLVAGYHYRIVDGRLLVWKGGACIAHISATGSSSTIFGTWTSNTLGVPDSVPAENRPHNCPEWDGDVLSPAAYEALNHKLAAVYDISASRLRTRTYGEPCHAELEVTAASLPGDGWTVTEKSCSKAKVRNHNTLKTAVFSSRHRRDGVTVTFAFEGKTCAKAYSSENTCAEVEANDASLEAFSGCIGATGFADTVVAAKTPGP